MGYGNTAPPLWMLAYPVVTLKWLWLALFNFNGWLISLHIPPVTQSSVAGDKTVVHGHCCLVIVYTLHFIRALFINPDKQMFSCYFCTKTLTVFSYKTALYGKFFFLIMISVLLFDDRRHSGEFLYIRAFRLPEKKRKRLKGGPSASRDPHVHCSYGPQEAEESPDLKSMFKKKWGWKTLQLFLRHPAEPQAVVWP